MNSDKYLLNNFKKKTKKEKIIKLQIKLKFINFIIFFSFIIIFYITNFIKIKHHQYLEQKIKNFEKIINITDNDINQFRIINSKNILLDNIKYNKSLYPDISIIITNFNQAHCIHKLLRSIQNQSIKNLEIIIIDDCSSDNSTKIIKNFQKEDKRIILIQHKINKGKIKSRSDGIRLAKGKYITIIDGDDAFIHKNILYNSLYIAYLGDLDVVEFKIITFRNGIPKACLNRYPIKLDKIIYQPELRTKFFLLIEDFRYRAIQNRNICGKIIKNEIFKKVLINIGPKYTEDYILRYEDTIMVVSLFQIAKSYYYMKQKGYYYSKDDKKIFKNNQLNLRKNIILGMDQVKLLQFLIEKMKNNKIERQLIYHEIVSIDYYSSFYQYINHHFEIVYNIFDKLIKSRFLTKNQKELLITLKLNLQKKEKEKKKILNISNILFM